MYNKKVYREKNCPRNMKYPRVSPEKEKSSDALEIQVRIWRCPLVTHLTHNHSPSMIKPLSLTPSIVTDL